MKSKHRRTNRDSRTFVLFFVIHSIILDLLLPPTPQYLVSPQIYELNIESKHPCSPQERRIISLKLGWSTISEWGIWHHRVGLARRCQLLKLNLLPNACGHCPSCAMPIRVCIGQFTLTARFVLRYSIKYKDSSPYTRYLFFITSWKPTLDIFA